MTTFRRQGGDDFERVDVAVPGTAPPRKGAEKKCHPPSVFACWFRMAPGADADGSGKALISEPSASAPGTMFSPQNSLTGSNKTGAWHQRAGGTVVLVNVIAGLAR